MVIFLYSYVRKWYLINAHHEFLLSLNTTEEKNLNLLQRALASPN